MPSPLSTLLRQTVMVTLLLGLSLPALADTVTLTPTADAYVQGGTYAATNYGSNTILAAQASATANSNYDSYLKFDTASSSGTVTSAKLRLYTALSALGTVSTSAYAVADTAWGETTITWNNKPALGASLGSLTVNSKVYAWKEFDVTPYVQSEKSAGRHVLTLALHNAATSVPYVKAYSRNMLSNQPQLVIVTDPPPVVSITTPANGSSYPAPASLNLTATERKMKIASDGEGMG